MSFDSLESSNYDGLPSLLYTFVAGSATPWRYHSGDKDRVVSGDTYLSVPISDNGIMQSGDLQNEDFTITLPASVDFASLFIGTPPSIKIRVFVRRINTGSTEAPIVWVGSVKSTKRKGVDTLDVVCKASLSSLLQKGLRLGWSISCVHALYDHNCRVSKAAFRVSATLTAVTGDSFVATAAGSRVDGWFDGGFVEWEIRTGIVERRAIESQVGTTVHLLELTDGLAVGMTVDIYPGCHRTTDHCINKFDNLANYGGIPGLAEKSPFDASPVF